MWKRGFFFLLSSISVGAGVLLLALWALRTMSGSTKDLVTDGRPEVQQPISAVPEAQRTIPLRPEAPMDLADQDLLSDLELHAAAEQQDLLELSLYQAELEAMKRNGLKKWEWVKERDYYRGMGTLALAEECFERPSLGFEMGLHEDPRRGIVRLRVFHGGFAELFDREDMYEGIIHVFNLWSAKLADPECDLGTRVVASIHLEGLAMVCGLSPVKEQVKGREEAFLDAHRQALRAFKSCCERYVSGELDGSLGFNVEAFDVGDGAMQLLLNVDESKHDALKRKIEESMETLPDDQTGAGRVLMYVTVVLQGLETR